MADTPDNPSTLDTWVAKLERKGFRPDKDRTALMLVPDIPLTFFADERTFTLTKVPPEHVAIMTHTGYGEYERGGVTATVNLGGYVIFYTNYERRPPVDTMGFFNSQGEPLDDAGREIQARLFD